MENNVNNVTDNTTVSNTNSNIGTTQVDERKFTQDDLNLAIKEALSEYSKNHFSQSDVDKRVTNALETNSKKLMAKFDEEKNTLMSEKITTEQQIAELTQKLEHMERQNKIKDNTMAINSLFAQNGLSGDGVNSIIGKIATDNSESSLGIAQDLINIILGEKERLSNSFDKKMSNVPKPTQSDKSATIPTKEEFDKFSIVQMIEFKKNFPDIAKQYMGLK